MTWVVVKQFKTDDIFRVNCAAAQLGALSLPDNRVEHKYLYEITVLTGDQNSATTDSKVSVSFVPASILLFRMPKVVFDKLTTTRQLRLPSLFCKTNLDATNFILF